MKEDVERPTRLIDITHLPLKAVEETADGGAEDRRARAEQRSRLPPDRRKPLSAAVERDPRGRLAAIAQHGVDRRQSAAADALLLLLRHRDALQQTRARQRLLGDQWRQPPARDPRRERGLHRRASLRHVRRARRARRDRARARARRASARFAFDGLPPPAGRHAAARHQSAAGGDHHGDRAAGRRVRGELHYLKLRDRLSYAFALVSVAAALKLDGDRIARSAARARRRRAQTVARHVGRDGAARTRGKRGELRAGRRPAAARRERLRAQRVQDRARPQGDRARADAGGERHAAVADDKKVR